MAIGQATNVDWRVRDQYYPIGQSIIINGKVCVVRMDRRRQSENCVQCAVKVANGQEQGVVTCCNLRCEKGEREDNTNVHFEKL